MNDKKTSKLGNFLAGVVWTVFVACLSALTIAMTIRVMLWVL